MKHPLRFGFIGAGAIAASSANGVNAHPFGKVIAATDTNDARLAELCQKCSIPHAYKTADDLFADKDVDVVYIAVPNKFHVPLTVKALEAGKHVILDKPFALNAEEAQLAVDAAQKNGKVLTLGMNLRFSDNAQKFRSHVEKGVFGEVYHAKAYWYRRAGIPGLGTWFCSKELAGSGCLYDIGVHLLDLCLYVTGNFKPVSVFGKTYTKFGNRGMGGGTWSKSENAGFPFEVEDFATGQILFENGMTVSLDVSWAIHREGVKDFDVEIFGTDAGGQVTQDKIFSRDAASGAFIQEENRPGEIRFAHKDRFHNFINFLRGEEDLCVTLEQAMSVQRILDAIAKSSETGESVKL